MMLPLYRFHVAQSIFAFDAGLSSVPCSDCCWLLFGQFCHSTDQSILLTFGIVIGPAISMKAIDFSQVVSILHNILF